MSEHVTNRAIDTFARGWIADRVRNEPMEKLRSRFKASIFVLSFLAIITALVMIMGWGDLRHRKLPVRLDVLLVLIFSVFAVSTVQMNRFIKLREKFDQQNGGGA